MSMDALFAMPRHPSRALGLLSFYSSYVILSLSLNNNNDNSNHLCARHCSVLRISTNLNLLKNLRC